MPLPELKEEIYQGLYVDKDLWMKMYHEIYEEVPVLAALIDALLQDAEKEKHPEDIQVGILQGAVYTYMLYKAQAESDDLAKQWGGV